jgi:excisionase family DNA binding protein
VTRDELELYTLAYVAELWQVSKRTIERRVAAGEIPTVTIGGRRRIRATDAHRIATSGTPAYDESTSTERGSG